MILFNNVCEDVIMNKISIFESYEIKYFIE